MMYIYKGKSGPNENQVYARTRSQKNLNNLMTCSRNLYAGYNINMTKSSRLTCSFMSYVSKA